MRREIGFAVRATPRRPLLALAAWSVPEALPTAISGAAIARAVDAGFLAGRPLVGLAWLGAFLLAGFVGAVGARQVYRRLGDLVEPFRDELVRRVVGGALRHGVHGRADDGAVARLTRQVEIVRDTHAGLIVLLNQFVVTVIGVVIGLLSISPLIALLMLPPFLLGFLAFLATLGLSATRQRHAVRAEERLAATAGLVLAGIRDVSATGTQAYATGLAAGPIDAQAAAERALARAAVLRTLCFAIGGWLPMVVLLLAGPWLVSRGFTAGAIMGGLTYVLIGLQPALRNVHAGLGGAGLRFVVTLGRILDASRPPEPRATGATRPHGYGLDLRGVTFAYGPHAEPVLRELDLTVPEGDHLAIVGPSGIGKSTLAGLLCGLLSPDGGTVRVGGVAAAELPPGVLAGTRVLIPQEAYVFAGTVLDNLTYLRPDATPAQVDDAVTAVGADALVSRLGGYPAGLNPAELSAGERQLLALARAYLSPAPLVVLDEATCHLDPVAERRAEKAFAARNGTLIVIAHRVSSALRAERVLVVDGARPAIGDHRSLLARSPLYRELLGHWEAGAGEQPRRAGTGEQERLPSVYGQVRRGGGLPLAGASMTLTDLAGRQLDRACTDGLGRYRLRAREGGRFLVICASTPHRPQAHTVTVAGAAQVRHDVVLPSDAGSLSGRVREADDGSAHGMPAVVVTLIQAGGEVTAATVTDTDGRFRFAELAGGSYTLTVVATAVRPLARTVEVPAAAHVERDLVVQRDRDQLRAGKVHR